MRGSREYQLLQQFYHRETLFDILGVSRQENPHSSFLAWLLDPAGGHGMNDFPLKRFMETVCFAFLNYGKAYLNEANTTLSKYGQTKRDAARNRLLFFGADAAEEDAERSGLMKRLMSGDFHVASCLISRERILKGKRRADIYMDLTVQYREKEEPATARLLVFIENKVHSDENDNQTAAYMDYMLGDAETRDFRYVVPIFLSPATNAEIKRHAAAEAEDKAFPCIDHLFLLLNYQYLLDGVISPCHAAYRDTAAGEILRDYISCLGKSIQDADEPTKKTQDDSSASVMAVGKDEKAWSCKLWEDHQDVLMDACRELDGTEAPFLTQNPADNQFFRTVLASVLADYEDRTKHREAGKPLSDAEQAEDAEMSKIRLSLQTGMRRYSYSVVQKDGTAWGFTSAEGNRRTLGALAYVIIRQYILNHKDEPIERIKGRLAGIKHGWLRGMLVGPDQLRELSEAWLQVQERQAPGVPVCLRYFGAQEDDGVWPNCTLSENSKNPVKAGKDPLWTGQPHGCPLRREFSGYTNAELFHWYYDKEPKGMQSQCCTCFYDFVDGFFVSGLKELLQEQEWGRDGKAALVLEERSGRKRVKANTAFGAIRVDGWVDDFVFVARYWGNPTIEKLLECLGMRNYVYPDADGSRKRLDFMVEDI